MAYADKYYGSFKDYFDRTVLITIQERDYTGASSEMTLQGAFIEYLGSDEEIYNPILSSTLTVNVISETNFQYIDLYSADSKKYKVIVTINASNYWIGFIIPDKFNEPYTTPPYVSSFTATDRLAELDSQTFNLLGIKTQDEILQSGITIATQDTDDILNIAISIFEENHVTTESALSQTYVDCERYFDKSWLEVLTDICNLYGARIYQKDGNFWITNIYDFKSEFSYFSYNGVSTVVGSGTIDNELFIGNPQDDKFSNVDQQLNILRGWQKLLLSIDLKKKESFIKNYDFSKWTITGYRDRVSGAGVTGTSVYPNWELDNWEGTARIIRGISDDTTHVQIVNPDIDSVPYTFITQTIGDGFKASDSKLLFTLKYAITGNPPINPEFWIRIEMWDGGSNYYYLTSEGTWLSTLNYINIENIEPSPDDALTFNEYRFSSINIPTDGALYVSIYAPSRGRLAIQEFKGEILNQNVEFYPEIIEYEKQININNNYINNEITLLTADFPDYGNTDTKNPTDGVGNEQYVYYGGLFLSSDKKEVTTQWQIKSLIDSEGFPNADQLHKIVSNQKEFLGVPKWAITGSILSQNIKPDSAIVDYQINNKKYLFNNGEFDLKSCIVNGTFIEIGNSTDPSISNWILDDGTWNDDGIWIDGETWNDTDPTP